MIVTLIIMFLIVMAQNSLQYEIDIGHLTDFFIILTVFAKRAMSRVHRILLFYCKKVLMNIKIITY